MLCCGFVALCFCLTAGISFAQEPRHLFWNLPPQAVEVSLQVGSSGCGKPLVLEAGRLNRLTIRNVGEAAVSEPLPPVVRSQLAILSVTLGGMKLELDSLDAISLLPGGEVVIEAVPLASGRWPRACGDGAHEIRDAGTAALPRAIEGSVPEGILPLPRPLPEFRLEAAGKAPLTRASLLGRWTLLFFGYTQCPDICPSTIARVSEALRALEPRTRKRDVSILFVSVDPERDTGALLEEYAGHFGPRVRAASAPHDRLAELTGALGVRYYVIDPKREHYSVAHTADLFLVAPNAQVLGRFHHDTGVDALARAIGFGLEHFESQPDALSAR